MDKQSEQILHKGVVISAHFVLKFIKEEYMNGKSDMGESGIVFERIAV